MKIEEKRPWIQISLLHLQKETGPAPPLRQLPRQAGLASAGWSAEPEQCSRSAGLIDLFQKGISQQQ
ncbi:MAG: hypothetical protein PHO64_06420 [Thiomonas sp.]|nr:hypothetical protein [Thiomonas sp.]